EILALMLSALFLASLGLRLGITVAAAPVTPPPPDVTEDALPVYTIIAALYHEAASVDGLLAAIERLNYPALGSKCTNLHRHPPICLFTDWLASCLSTDAVDCPMRFGPPTGAGRVAERVAER